MANKIPSLKQKLLKALASPRYGLLVVAFVLLTVSLFELSKLTTAQKQAQQLSVTSSSSSSQQSSPQITKPKTTTKPKPKPKPKPTVTTTVPKAVTPKPTHVVVPSPVSHAHGLKPKT